MRLLRLSLRSFAGRAWLPVSCAAAVLLGVALMVSTRVADASLRAGHEGLLRALRGGADLSVRRAGTLTETAALEGIERLPGVAAAAPVLSVDAALAAAQGAGTVRILGIDPVREEAFRRFPSPRQALPPAAMAAWAMRTDGVVATAPCAQALGLVVGSTLKVGTARGIRTLVVRGVVDLPAGLAPYGRDWLFMEISAAQYLFGREGKCDRIDVALAPGADREEVRAAIQDTLRDPVVETPEEACRDAWAAIEAFRAGLGVVSLFATAVGAYLVAGTLAYLASERMREIGILRAIGASRRQVRALLVGEGVVLGLAGAIPGVPAGWLLAAGTIRLLGDAYRLTAVSIPVAPLRLDDPATLLAPLAGVAAAALAAVLPASLASRGPAAGDPARLLRRGRPGLAARALLPLAGAALLGAAFLLHAYPDRPGRILGYATGYLMVLLMAAAAGGLVPAAAQALLRIFRALVPAGGGARLAARLAADSLLRAPGRTAMTVLVLSLVVGLTVGAAVIAKGFRGTIGRWLRTFEGHLVVATTAEAFTNVRSFRPLPEKVFTDLAAVEGVRAVLPMRFSLIPCTGGEALVIAMDAGGEGRPRMALTQGDADEVRARLPTEDAVVASDNFCRRRGVGVGDAVVLQGSDGRPRPYVIVARATEYSWPFGVLYMDRARYARGWGDGLADAATILVDPATPLDRAKGRLRDALGGAYPVRLFVWDEYQGVLLRQFDEFYRVQHAQTLLGAVLGLFGIFVALGISARSRAREFALLRAAGLDRRGLARILHFEALLLTLLGWILGVGMGQLAHLPAVTVSLLGAGYTFDYAFAPGAALGALAACVAAGWLAAVGPVRRTLASSPGRTLAPE